MKIIIILKFIKITIYDNKKYILNDNKNNKNILNKQEKPSPLNCRD